MLSAGKMLQKSQNAKQQNVCQRNKKQRSQKIKNYTSIYTVKKKLQQTLQNVNAINLLSIFKIYFSQYYCNLLYA